MRNVSRETVGEMFHVKRSREGEMFHVKQKRVAFRSPAGGVSGWSPADLAFSLLFCPHPPDPRSQSALPGGKGEIFDLFCRGLAPPAPLLLNLRGAGLPEGSAPCIPGAKPGRHWLFLPHQCFLPPSPRPPSPVGKGETLGYFMQGASPLASPGLNPGGTGLPGGAGAPAHPCYRSRAALVIPSERNHINITGSTRVNAYL